MKRFTVVNEGYNMEEVNRFIDIVIKRLEKLNNENAMLQTKISSLEEKLKELERLKESPISSDTLSKELVQRFLQSAYTSRELLVSLIERIELTETKQIIIKFRFPELEAIS